MSQIDTERYIDKFYPDGIPDSVLISLYSYYQPFTDHSEGAARNICILIEEIARTRGVILPKLNT